MHGPQENQEYLMDTTRTSRITSGTISHSSVLTLVVRYGWRNMAVVTWALWCFLVLFLIKEHLTGTPWMLLYDLGFVFWMMSLQLTTTHLPRSKKIARQ